MSVQVLVLKESAAGEKRVAATPETVKKLAAADRRARKLPGAASCRAPTTFFAARFPHLAPGVGMSFGYA